MALGFFDALFPTTVPGFGSSTPTRRLGDVLLSGKAYMASQSGLDGQSAGDTYYEHQLYHLLGDPSMQMWAAPPVQFDPGRIDSKVRTIARSNPGDPPFQVEVAFEGGSGAVATLFHGDEPIGRGTVGSDGKATILPERNTDTQDLTVRFQREGALPVQDTVVQVTTLTLTGPAAVAFDKGATFSGHLDPAFAGAPVRVVYTPDSSSNGSPIEHTAVTNGGGNYSDSVTIPRSQQGAWHAQAFYDGDSEHLSSSSAALAFTVGP
jgi:hypothetical protein